MTESRPDRTDLDQIFRILLPRAQEALQASGGRLSPIGAALDQNGRLHAALSLERAERLQPADVLQRLLDDFRTQAANGHIRACGVAYDAQVQGPAGTADAIAVGLEHESGEAAVIYLPYARTTSGTFEFGSLIPAAAPRQIWS